MVSYIDPTETGFAQFKALPRDMPIHMLNLLKYRDMAKYPPGHPDAGKGWSGKEAYREYGRTSGPIFARAGGEIIWRGRYEAMVTGPEEAEWDDGFIAAYPNAAAFFEMIKDPDYQQAVINRTAALADSRLVRFLPGAVGKGFA